MPLSRKLLIGTATCASLGFVSWLVWSSFQQPKVSPNPLDVPPKINNKYDKYKLDVYDGQLLQEKPKQLPHRSNYIAQSDLSDLLRSQSKRVIIDVRDEKMDHSGGHIVGSINISDKMLYDSIPDIIQKYAKSPILIMYCMYGYRRSVKCMEIYVKAISELIANYNKDTKTSYYSMYSLSAQSVDDSSSQLLYAQCEWMDETVTQKNVQIEFCDDAMIANLQKQKLYVLEGGFFKWINNAKNTELVEGFDQSHYEQLELRGVYNKKMYYHKNEYFAKRKFSVFASK